MNSGVLNISRRETNKKGDERREDDTAGGICRQKLWQSDADGASSDASRSSRFLPANATVRIQFFQLSGTPHGFGVILQDFHSARFSMIVRATRNMICPISDINI